MPPRASGERDLLAFEHFVFRDALSQVDGRLQRIADRGSPEDQERVDLVHGGPYEVVIPGRGSCDLRLPREDDEPHPQAIGRLVEERADCLLGRAQPRRLDVLRLHRP